MRKPKPKTDLTQAVGLYVTPEQLAALDRIGKRLGGVSRGAVLRIALAEYIERHTPGAE